MAHCKFGKLKSPVRTASGGKRVCKKKPKGKKRTTRRRRRR